MGGELGDNLGDFGAILAIDVIKNHIGGTIPSNFPSTIRNLSLSANKLIGSIPNALSSSSQLMNFSLCWGSYLWRNFAQQKGSWCTTQYVPSNYNEIFDIMNLLEDRLQHTNGVVVLATIKVFL